LARLLLYQPCDQHYPSFSGENVMKKLPYLLILSGLVSAPAFAESSPLTDNVGFTTDYVFRGITQTQHQPAVSGGIDYAHSSGLYIGTWLSNQKWVQTGGTPTGAAADPYKANSSLEWDIYGGYKGSAGDFGYDLGAIHYYYPGDKVAGAVTPDTTELYVAGSWKMLTLKYSHVVSDYFIGWGSVTAGSEYKTKGSNYLELNLSQDLGNGWGVLAHVGHQKVEKDNLNFASYSDWKVGVTKDVGFGTVTLAYSDTNADNRAYGDWDGKKVGKGVTALSFTKSF
jgi:uncharacterized protein (TIGR02001 family)